MPSDFHTIDQYVAASIAKHGIANASYAIVANGRIVHVGSQSRAGVAPTSAESLFGIGSLSKSFTAAAVIQLFECGKLDIDEPVQQYLPEFRPTSPAAGQITTRHLLNQTSGLPKIAGFWRGNQFDSDYLAKRVADLKSVRLDSVPGAHFQYSNANYDVLGRLIEVVGGLSYGQYVAKNILAPLGMLDTLCSFSEHASRFTVGYQDWMGVPMRAPASSETHSPMPSGGIVSSAQDMGTWLIAHMTQNTRLLSEVGYQLLHAGAMDAYAMGWVDGLADGHRIWRHEGATPSYTSSMIILPDEDLGVVVLTNTNALLLMNPPAVVKIVDNVVRLMRGEAPVDRTSGISDLQFKVFALTFAALTLLLPLPMSWGIFAAVPFVIIGIASAIALVFLLPKITRTPFWAMLMYVPDLISLLIVLSAGSLLKAAWTILK